MANPPRDPKKKGRVESGVKYVKANFFPLREFRTLGDANAQLAQWVMSQPEPSTADKRITERIKSALALLDIRVLDHIIVGDSCYSFAQSGEL
jgi:hypothetical protein